MQIVAERKEGVLQEAVTMTASIGESIPSAQYLYLEGTCPEPKLRSRALVRSGLFFEVISKAGAIKGFFDLGFTLMWQQIF